MHETIILNNGLNMPHLGFGTIGQAGQESLELLDYPTSLWRKFRRSSTSVQSNRR